MTLEEMAVLSALSRYGTLNRPTLTTMAKSVYPKTSEERLWLVAVDNCLAKRWIDYDNISATYAITLRGATNLKTDWQLVQNLVASLKWLG